jgi:hypothetical protein
MQQSWVALWKSDYTFFESLADLCLSKHGTRKLSNQGRFRDFVSQVNVFASFGHDSNVISG